MTTLYDEFSRYQSSAIQHGSTMQTYERWLEQQVIAARLDRDKWKARCQNMQLDMAALIRPPGKGK